MIQIGTGHNCIEYQRLKRQLIRMLHKVTKIAAGIEQKWFISIITTPETPIDLISRFEISNQDCDKYLKYETHGYIIDGNFEQTYINIDADHAPTDHFKATICELCKCQSVGLTPYIGESRFTAIASWQI